MKTKKYYVRTEYIIPYICIFDIIMIFIALFICSLGPWGFNTWLCGFFSAMLFISIVGFAMNFKAKEYIEV